MRSLFISMLLLFPVEYISFAQETLKIQDASSKYDLVVQVEACGGEEQNDNPNNCSGMAHISIYRKSTKFPSQILHLRNVEVYKDTIAHNPKINTKPRMLYEEEYSFVFDDFNFDSNEDLAICNGRNGGYGGPSYQGITVNAIDPGPTDTGWLSDDLRMKLLKRAPFGRIGTVDDAGKLVLYLASSEAQWVTGQVIRSRGGL